MSVARAEVSEDAKREAEMIADAAAVEAEAIRPSDGGISKTLWHMTAKALEKYGVAFLSKLKPVTYGEVLKDPQGARGKAIRFTGTVRSIKRMTAADGGREESFQGVMVESLRPIEALKNSDERVLQFYTPLATTGIEDRTEATFVGLFIQNSISEPMATKRLILVIGGFEPPER